MKSPKMVKDAIAVVIPINSNFFSMVKSSRKTARIIFKYS